MIIEKLFSKQSTYYKNLNPRFSKIGKLLDDRGLIHLFSIWTLTVCGIVINMNSLDRYVYWDWSNWLMGSLKLILSTILFTNLFFPKKIWKAGVEILSIKEILLHSLIALCLIIFGWINYNMNFSSIVYLLPYLLSFISCLLIFQFTLVLDKEKGEWNIYNWDNKSLYLSISGCLMLVAVCLGVLLDDPIVTTAGMVSIPYAFIALIWPNHVRHLQRARFYPLFTFAMFLSVRTPWFLIPLVILFFILRTLNYFRYGITYPSFAVDFLEDE